MDGAQYRQTASEARVRRDNRVAGALRDIIDAEVAYKGQIDGLRQLSELVEGDAPEVFAERLNLAEFSEWAELEPTVSPPKSDLDRIRQVLPARNELFGLGDLKKRFAKRFPSREIGPKVWPVYLGKLCASGEVLRVRRQKGGRPGVYALAGSKFEQEGDSRTQAEVAFDVLRDTGKAMTLVEIVDAMLAKEFNTSATPKTLRQNVLRGFRRHSDVVRAKGDKWELVKRTSQ